MIGKTINNYIIERKLGQGGMGSVYFARHNRINRMVAIKVLHQNLFTNENIRNRFKNEANALIKLEHPNIVKIYDYVEQDNLACLIMEYIEGDTLDDYISKISGPLVTSKATHIICNVLDAVQYAHDNNIYHRDIKPGNIMVSKDGMTVRIMDFGIAKFMDGENFKNTHANTQLGTPFYMSPEQVKGLSYTGVSDIYSLGVTLFEMVTGKCPYQSITNLFELQNKIVNEPLPPTNTYYPDVSPRLQAAIIKATEKKPGHRFLSCKEFKTFLQADAEHDSGSSALHDTKLKRGNEKAKDQNINPFPQPPGNISITKNITPPNLLETYPAKKRKSKAWVIILLLALFLGLSGLYYYKKNKGNGEEIAGESTKEEKKTGPGISDSVQDPLQILPNLPPPDTIKKDITVTFPIEDQDTTSRDTPEKNSPISNIKYLRRSQVMNDVKEAKLSCGGEIFIGGRDQKTDPAIPSPEDQYNINDGETMKFKITLTDKTTGKQSVYQLFYRRIGNSFSYYDNVPYQ